VLGGGARNESLFSCPDCPCMSLALLSCVLLLSQKLSLLELRHAVQSLRGSEARLLSQKALLDAKMTAAVASPPPPPAPPALQYEDDARSVGSTVNIQLLINDQVLSFFEFARGDLCARVFVCFQDKVKERSSRFDTLRLSLSGMIRHPKAMLTSSTSVRSIVWFPKNRPVLSLLLPNT